MMLGVFVCWRGHATKLRAEERHIRQTMALPCETCRESAYLTDVMTLPKDAPKPSREGWRVVDGGKP